MSNLAPHHKRGRDSGATNAMAGLSARVMLALRAGGMEGAQLIDRYGDAVIPLLGSLAAKGLVTSGHTGTGRIYRLTQAGRATCPSRRQLEGADHARAMT